ncbi:CatB-related O-acetyltransferase [Mucilaginibacter sp.]|uniref:CatB-related O-acetyltransferase n=1 Tax=Mucilaginibacter sp. TaxID=1882438 RepID=UPI002609AD05|nr:CatB-related O-acetyltransferase [Mucilaginibacter sp.]
MFEHLKYYISRIKQLAKNQIQYPDCKFYNGSILINSQLGHYNILFQNAQVINSIIGSHSYIQKRSTVVNANIGKFCSMASDVSIGPGIHKLNGISTHPSFFLKNTPLIKKYSQEDAFISSKETVIGHDVWIGEKAIILDGVSIGTGAVIAAGAIVTKDVAPYAIVGGVPAKVLRMRFNSIEIDGILKSKWWDKDEEWLQQNYKSFNNVLDFTKMINEKLS